MFLNLKRSYSHLLSIHLETPKIALVLLLVFFFVRPQVLHENVEIPWLGIFSKARENLLSPCFFLIENLSGKIATGRWTETGYVGTSLLGITWQNKHHRSTLFAKEQMGCASANDLCAANWFSRHSWAFQYVCHQLFDSGMSSKDVKHNPGQHYQRPKNYELFSQKKKEIRKKKLATGNRDSLRRASSW